MPELTVMRLDKWLWAARFYKTRALAQKQIELGRVRVNGEKVKNSKNIKAGDTVDMTYNHLPYRLTVKDLSSRRGPAAAAQLLYSEDNETQKQRQELKSSLTVNSGVYQSAYKEGRPTKKDRRTLDKLMDKNN